MRKLVSELKQLHIRFSEMGMMVSEAINKAVEAFINHDKTLANTVIAADQQINKREVELEQRSLELIALQQPVTSDLRDIVTIMKVCNDLEGMGDHAVSIAKITIHVKNKPRVPMIEAAIGQTAQIVKVMVTGALDAYLRQDAQLAQRIAMMDQQVNQHVHVIYQHCIAAMQTNEKNVAGTMDYSLVANYLERIGDYVTNICEWIVYLRTGKIYELHSGAHDEYLV